MKLEPMAWDSKHFGMVMGRLRVEGPGSKFPDRSDYDFVMARVAEVNAPTLESAGFRLADVRVYYRLRFEDWCGDVKHVNLWESELDSDIIRELKEIARTAFTHSRFYQDPRFDRTKVGEMYAHWIDRCVSDGCRFDIGYQDGSVAAFVATKRGHIELIATAKKQRRKSIAIELLVSVLRNMSRTQKTATVETQLSNIPAINLYERVGFKLAHTEFTLHWWR